MSLTPAASSALADPLRALLLWGLVLTGKLEPGLLRLLGLKDVDIASIEAAYGPALVELRVLTASLTLFDPQQLGQLAMVRIGSLLLSGGQDDLLKATRALARLPLWARDPELDALEREARRESATTRILEAHAKQAELRERSDTTRSAARWAASSGARTAGPSLHGARTDGPSLHGAPVDRPASSGARDSSPVTLGKPASVGIAFAEKEEDCQARPGAPEEAPNAAKNAFLVANLEAKVKSAAAKPRPKARRKTAMRR